jgi:hypothetical protein
MDGEYAGVAILEKGIRDIDKNINEIKAMPVSFKKITENTK